MLGLIIYGLALVAIALWLPAESLDVGSNHFLLALGGLAIWRYSWGCTHLARGMYYRWIAFPRMRAKAEALGVQGNPAHVYLLVTSFRIDTETTLRVIRGAALEAARLGCPATLVASIVERRDERIFREAMAGLGLGDKVELKIVRLAGSGKRDGLAGALRAIADMRPPEGSLVALIDGDTVLCEGALTKTVGFFKLNPKMDALTTDEVCELHGKPAFNDFYNLRFAQRQIQMCSVSLSKRVLTLTGRMSLYRAEVACNPDFINLLQRDSTPHWRLGTIQFLTGDDKSTWYWILKTGREMMYVPDVKVITVESPPNDSLVLSATILMRRWFGNMMRNGGRAIALGPKPMGFFVWWCCVDQRLCMWTTLVGPIAAIGVSVMYSPIAIFLYLYWIALTRFAQTLVLTGVRGRSSWRYPFLLYFLQVYGSLIKVYTLFRLDRQSWTRQKTKAVRAMSQKRAEHLVQESRLFHAASFSLFSLGVLIYSGAVNPADLGIVKALAMVVSHAGR